MTTLLIKRERNLRQRCRDGFLPDICEVELSTIQYEGRNISVAKIYKLVSCGTISMK